MQPAEPKIPEIGEGKRGADGHLIYLLRQAGTAMQLAADRALAELDLTLAQYSALTMIHAYENLSNADVARLSMLTPQSAHEVVQRLLARGFIRKEASADNRRIQVLSITETGKVVLEAARTRSDALESVLREEIPAGIEPDLRRWLVAVAKRLSAK